MSVIDGVWPMYCQLCGNIIEEGDLFCRNCGETSKSLTLIADRPNFVAQGAFFIGGVLGFAILFFIITQILVALDPTIRSPILAIWILIVMGGIASGAGAILLMEYRGTRRKLLEEREKRRVLLSGGKIAVADAEEVKALQYSVIDQTTQKFKV